MPVACSVVKRAGGGIMSLKLTGEKTDCKGSCEVRGGHVTL